MKSLSDETKQKIFNWIIVLICLLAGLHGVLTRR
jgi:hypothetical protein